MSLADRIAQIRKSSHKRIQGWKKKLGIRVEDEKAAKHDKIADARKGHERVKPFRMFDSITLDAIPAGAHAVAGYVNGNWPTFLEVKQRWPKAKHLSIAVDSTTDAECLDVEPGDATPADAATWLRRQQKRGIKVPVIYVGLSEAQTLLNTLTAAGVKRSEYRLWTAHYRSDQKPHLCDSSCGLGFTGKADATQFTCTSAGKNLDESLCSAGFLG